MYTERYLILAMNRVFFSFLLNELGKKKSAKDPRDNDENLNNFGDETSTD